VIAIDNIQQYLINKLDSISSIGEVPVAAAIELNGRVVSTAWNSRETSNSPISHAELLAIEDATRILGRWRLSDCILHTTLEPCPMCMAAAQQARLKKIIYFAKDVNRGAISLKLNLHNNDNLNHKIEVEYSENELASKKLKAFFHPRRSK